MLTESSMEQHLNSEKISRFAMIFRGMIICIMMSECPEDALQVFQQGTEIVQLCEAVLVIITIVIWDGF